MIKYLHLNVLTVGVNTYQYLSHRLDNILLTSVILYKLQYVTRHSLKIHSPALDRRSCPKFTPLPLGNVCPRQSKVPLLLEIFRDSVSRTSPRVRHRLRKRSSDRLDYSREAASGHGTPPSGSRFLTRDLQPPPSSSSGTVGQRARPSPGATVFGGSRQVTTGHGTPPS